jgi:hypothetical protein
MALAKEISRAYDFNLAAVIVSIQDEFGITVPHTIHLMNVNVCPVCQNRKLLDVNGNVDVDATVAQIITATDAANATLRQKFIAAGWTPK